MISWLKANKIPFNENRKKPELYEIVMSKKPAPVSVVVPPISAYAFESKITPC
jgi:hypothetical protein